MRYRLERDEWVPSGPSIDDLGRHQLIQSHFEWYGEDALLILMRKYLNGGTGPTLSTCKTMAEFNAFLETVEPGDIIDVWSAWSVCTRDKLLTWGKKTDIDASIDGCIPVYGEDALVVVAQQPLDEETTPHLVACRSKTEFDDFLDTVDFDRPVNVWAAWSVCTRDKKLTWGKKPDEEGYVPLKGAY